MWLKNARRLGALDYKALENAIAELDVRLTLRTHLVGHSWTLADIVVWATLRGNRIASATIKKYINVARWYNYVETLAPWMSSTILDLYSLNNHHRVADHIGGSALTMRGGRRQSGVVTRFPPEPSGYLHIGHAKAALLNDMLAHDQPHGTLICRFDDTNPSKESEEFQDAIMQDLNTLGVRPDRVSYSSDYFREMYEACKGLIRSGNAYADDTDADAMKNRRRNGEASPHRDMSPADTLAHYEEMKSGSDAGQAWCIRARISVDNVNKSLRDPVIYRCISHVHHRTGSTWKMYPTYDFCAPFMDAVEGVTHALRTTEYNDRNAQYQWMQEALGVSKVPVQEFSRLSFVRAVLSKRNLTKLVDKGVVWGWDDPRMPTIRGILRRGMTVPALRDFIRSQGPSRNVVSMDWASIWATNKKYIGPVAPRYTAVATTDMVVARVLGIKDVQIHEKPKLPRNPALGTKKVVYSHEIFLEQSDAKSLTPNEEITLMNWGNAIVRHINTDINSGVVKSLELQAHPTGDFKKTDKKITWLAQQQDLTPVELVTFDHLITKEKLGKDEDVLAFLTEQTEFRSAAWADCNVAALEVGTVIQFERKGFFRVDTAFTPGSPAVLFGIPTGREK